MNDFQKTLEALKAADLTFIVPSPGTPHPAENKRRRNKSTAGKKHVCTVDTPTVSSRTPTPTELDQVVIEAIDESAENRRTNAAPQERPFGEHKLPAFIPPDKPTPASLVIGATPATDSAADAPRKRRHLDHEWPAIGAILAGTYFGTTYHAEVVAANKRLKSGKQLRLLDGPAKGRRLDSFTKALLVATARQRREGKLKRKSASNVWSFWREAVAETAR